MICCEFSLSLVDQVSFRLNVVFIKCPFDQLSFQYTVVSDGFSGVRTERPHRPPLKTSKSEPPQQYIALFLRSSTMTKAPLK